MQNKNGRVNLEKSLVQNEKGLVQNENGLVHNGDLLQNKNVSGNIKMFRCEMNMVRDNKNGFDELKVFWARRKLAGELLKWFSARDGCVYSGLCLPSLEEEDDASIHFFMLLNVKKRRWYYTSIY